jgi:tRNA dimethylallyltransferase
MKARLLVIVGPTASGKTQLAIELATHFQTEILMADSRQVYKELNIGTAKPGLEERKGIRHHFVDHVSIHDSYNAGIYAREANEILDSLFKNNPVAIMAGGTGLFIKAAIEGLNDLPQANVVLRQQLQEQLKIKGTAVLADQLKILDPVYVATADLSNHQRLIRALEVCLVSGKPFSSFFKSNRDVKPYDIVYLGLDLPRTLLYRRINERADKMMKEGFPEEAKALLPFKDYNALQTVGYKELFAHLEGNYSLKKAVDLIKQHTRNYAKRQMTWFRKIEGVHWFEEADIGKVLEII